jgi:hypothetical protein
MIRNISIQTIKGKNRCRQVILRGTECLNCLKNGIMEVGKMKFKVINDFKSINYDAAQVINVSIMI